MGRHLRLAIVALLVVACGGAAPSASVAPTSGGPSAAPTDAATIPPASEPPGSGEPSTAPSGTIGTPVPLPGSVLAPGTAVEVLAVELNLRRKPTTSSRRVSLLRRGDVVVVAPVDNLLYGWGPVEADGFTWYPVFQVSSPDGRLPPLPTRPVYPLDGEPVFGWVAQGDGTRPFIRAMAPRCPSTVNLTNVAGMLPAERLSCFGANSFVLEGTFGCAFCEGLAFGTYDPIWLAGPVEIDFLSVDPSVTFGPLALRFPPGGPSRPEQGSIIRVTVHVHDARAEGCSITDMDGSGATVVVHPESAELFCRERVVVESYEVLGTDPRFPG